MLEARRLPHAIRRVLYVHRHITEKRENLVWQRHDQIQNFLFVSCFPNNTSINDHLVYMLLKMQEKTEKLSSGFLNSLYKGSQ